MTTIDSLYEIISCPYCKSRFENNEKLSRHEEQELIISKNWLGFEEMSKSSFKQEFRTIIL